MFKEAKAIIFDMDGTLLDSMGLWARIDRDFLASRGIPHEEGIQEAIGGRSMRQTAVWFQEHFSLTDSVDELCTEWNGMAYEAYRNQIAMKADAKRFLDLLTERHIPMAIATSNSRYLLEAAFDQHNFRKIFAVSVTSDEISKGKPAPDVYLAAAKGLALNPKDCLVFEDLLEGIAAGQSAGMRVCAMEDPYSAKQKDQKQMQADYYAPSYAYLIEQLEKEMP